MKKYDVYSVSGYGNYAYGRCIIATDDENDLIQQATLGREPTYKIEYTDIKKLDGVYSDFRGMLDRNEFGE